MTIAELLARIGLAFVRTFNFVMKGAFSDVVLLDFGIIVAVFLTALLVCLIIWSVVLVFRLMFSPRHRRRTRRR